jgi:hypothetical protein
MKKRFSGALAVVLGIFASTASAQVGTTGTLNAVIEATDGSRLPGASVSVEATDTTSRRSGVSNAQGEVMFVNLEPSARYTVTVQLAGFQTVKNERILVRAGQSTALKLNLAVASAAEEVTVTADSPLVDTTSAIQGQDITLELTESLPTGRTYQSYLELVPGVGPSDPLSPGNPPSKSGVNFTENGNLMGRSTDNVYYIDGVNVTDGVSGTFGANLNTEIIQEQNVVTGGIPAEFIGAAGLISSVVTKSGSDHFHGSVNYYLQNDGLVADNKNLPDATFSTYDTAVTLGGPLVKDKAWFFGSFRRFNRDDAIVARDTGVFLRDVNRKDNQGYGKVSATLFGNDNISATYVSDPTSISGSTDPLLLNARSRAREQGGHSFGGRYTRMLGSASLDLGFTKHNGEVSDFSSIRESSNTIVFRRTDVRTLADEQKGGFGSDLVDQRDTSIAHGNLQWSLGSHSLKIGADYQTNSNFRNSLTIGESKSIYTSLNPALSGLNALQVVTSSLSSIQFDVRNPSDINGLITTINGLPNRAAFYNLLDLDGNGVISGPEVGSALVFNSSANNPGGAINYYRIAQVADGPQLSKSKGVSFFGQDTVRLGRMTLNAGVRAERFQHFSTTGETIFTFDWTLAPRVSLAFDVKGDGRQKVSAYFGRYFDPGRNNLTNFAGSHSGRTQEQQVFILGQWVNYRTRGGASLDAVIAPATKTPRIDDLQVGYEIDLGRNMSVEALYTKRWTRNLLEDYDPSLYATAYPGPVDDPNSLALPFTHFGFPESGLPGVANFFIATLEGAKRDYQGVDLVFRRRFVDNWQVLAWYSYNDSKGNSNSDSTFDFQGDDLVFDPRAPNMYGRMNGSIKHIAQFAGSYRFPFGLELGPRLRWNSGTYASLGQLASARNLPAQVELAEAFSFAGITNQWVAPGAIGALVNPGAFLADMRFKYIRKLSNATGEVFVDVFNVFDNQRPVRNQDLVAGQGGITFGQGLTFNDPRRFFVGARLSF